MLGDASPAYLYYNVYIVLTWRKIMANKEDLLRDINIVTTLCSKYDFKDAEHVNKVLKFLDAKKPFKTQVGALYTERLKQKKAGNNTAVCFLCRKVPSYDGVLCEACMSKYTRGTKKFYGMDDVSQLESIFENDKKTASGQADTENPDRLSDDNARKIKDDLSSKVIAAGDRVRKFAEDNDLAGKAQSAKDRAVKFAKDNNLNEKASAAKKKTNILLRRMKKYGIRLSKKQHILLLLSISILVLLIIVGSIKISGRFRGGDELFSGVEKNTIEYDEEMRAYLVHSKIDYYITQDAYGVATGNTDFERVINEYIYQIAYGKDVEKTKKLFTEASDIAEPHENPGEVYDKLIDNIPRDMIMFDNYLQESEIENFMYGIWEAEGAEMLGKEVIVVGVSFQEIGSRYIFLIKRRGGWRIYYIA